LILGKASLLLGGVLGEGGRIFKKGGGKKKTTLCTGAECFWDTPGHVGEGPKAGGKVCLVVRWGRERERGRV